MHDIEQRIRFEKILTPQDWEEDLQVFRGATFNLAHNHPADAALAAAQPVRGSGRRLSGRRRHASGQRPAGDLRERPHHRAAADGGSGHLGRLEPGIVDGAAGHTNPPIAEATYERACPLEASCRSASIGAGLGGLAAACTLAARGHRVVLFDKNPWLGGKAAVLEEDGFRFDMGPTILTVPARAGAHLPRSRARHARLSRPAPARPAMALLLRRRQRARPAGRRAGDGRTSSSASRPATAPATATSSA